MRLLLVHIFILIASLIWILNARWEFDYHLRNVSRPVPRIPRITVWPYPAKPFELHPHRSLMSRIKLLLFFVSVFNENSPLFVQIPAAQIKPLRLVLAPVLTIPGSRWTTALGKLLPSNFKTYWSVSGETKQLRTPGGLGADERITSCSGSSLQSVSPALTPQSWPLLDRLMLPVMPTWDGLTVEVPGYSKCTITGRSELVSINSLVLLRLRCSKKMWQSDPLPWQIAPVLSRITAPLSSIKSVCAVEISLSKSRLQTMAPQSRSFWSSKLQIRSLSDPDRLSCVNPKSHHDAGGSPLLKTGIILF